MQMVDAVISRLRARYAASSDHLTAYVQAAEQVEQASKEATATLSEPIDTFVRDISGGRTRKRGNGRQQKRARAR